tara:strand:+ start:166 stop:474 length:309 start_codon:yes stop_codon:yes gene_type:complete
MTDDYKLGYADAMNYVLENRVKHLPSESLKVKPESALMHCPDCGSEKVTLREERLLMANTLEYWRYNVKASDATARSSCLTCGWRGLHAELIGYQDTTNGQR